MSNRLGRSWKRYLRGLVPSTFSTELRLARLRAPTVRNAGPTITLAYSTPLLQVINDRGLIPQVAGPMWCGPIHDKSFTKEVLEAVNNSPQSFGTHARMQGMLTLASEA